MQLSPLYLYFQSRRIIGTEVEGSTLLATIRALKGKGVCRLDLWPNDPQFMPNENELPLIDQDAALHRIECYSRLYNLNEIKAILAQHIPVSISFRIFNSFSQASENGIVPLPVCNESIIDTHAVQLVGYNDNQPYTFRDGRATVGFFTFQNSWGTNWGDNGYGYLPYAYIDKYAIEIYVGMDREQMVPLKRIEEYPVEHNNEQLNINVGLFNSFPGSSYNHFLLINLYDQNDQVVGWLISSKVGKSIVEIIDFFVYPDYREKGYGSIIVDFYLQYEKVYGIDLLFGLFPTDDMEKDSWIIISRYFKNKGFTYIHNLDIFQRISGVLHINPQKYNT